MKSNAIREAFLEFFRQRGHQILPSSSLIPGNDPSLLFTNAGMVQFKEVFLGIEQRAYRRAASSQRCVRAGGKHNDLENVGYTARHHTFFEMLGNFSFGDYFKAEAIAWAWELLTDGFGLPADRLWVTVHESDTDAAAIWLRDIGVDPARFSRCGDSDNFWMMGNTGPCGPCSEIFFDHGPAIAGGPPGTPQANGDRYVEIWNLVFTQYNRDEYGTLNAIPRPSVDTGMGLERIAAALQGVHSNYKIDLFQNLIRAVFDLAGRDDLNRQSVQVIADHIRSCAFLIADGVVPANEGRGYVLRRIIRRALRHGHKLGFNEPFFHRLVGTLESDMGAAYPLLTRMQGQVERVLLGEEQKFAETLDQGMRLMEQSFAQLSDREIPGEIVFRLYDTFGFPVDLTADVARERGLSVDLVGFEAAMEQQRDRARAASRFTGIDVSHALPADAVAVLAPKCTFTGYEGVGGTASVLAIIRDGRLIDQIDDDGDAIVVLDRTPFYAESGGQVGDCGRITTPAMEFTVTDTLRQAGLHLHIGCLLNGTLRVGDEITAAVNAERRQATRLNHSATHLLHAALREVLGHHISQKGSLVEPERLRFDFAHSGPVRPDELIAIETRVNQVIRNNLEVTTAVLPYQQAIDSGATALFGEKYGDSVRVLRMGDFSVELCGGTHVARSGDIGLFRIVSESGVAAGVRRIEAVTGVVALAQAVSTDQVLSQVAERLRSKRDDIGGKLDQLLLQLRNQEREIEQLKAKLASGTGTDLAAQSVEINGVKVIASLIEGADSKSLRTSLDHLKDRLGHAAIVLAAVEDGKVRLVAGVTKGLTDRISAGDLVNFVAEQVGGRGGGRPDMAQAGGDNPNGLPAALTSVTDWVAGRLQ